MKELVCLYGTGDTFAICALLPAFKVRHGYQPMLVVKEQHAAIAAMFEHRCRVDDDFIVSAETDELLHATYPNSIHDDVFYAHPHFVRTPARLDRLVAKGRISHADMYRALLSLPLDAPLARPRLPTVEQDPNTALLVPEARSWPSLDERFWSDVAARLRDAGWRVEWNDRAWSFGELLARCAAAGWVITPQCGVAAILCEARFPCRKTIVSRDFTSTAPGPFGITSAFPYGYERTVAGEEYDIDQYAVGDANAADVIEAIITGPNGRRLAPHDPAPIQAVEMPLAVSDFIDRWSIQRVKQIRFDGDRRAASVREYARYQHAACQLSPELAALADDLYQVHLESFDLFELMVPTALVTGEMSAQHHVAAIALNHRRVLIKQRIDAVARPAFSEVKSYYV